MLQKQRLDVSAHHDVILGHFETMCSCFSQVDESVGFASGRTTEQVADDLVTAYNAACSHSPDLDSLPVERINEVMVDAGVQLPAGIRLYSYLAYEQAETRPAYWYNYYSSKVNRIMFLLLFDLWYKQFVENSALTAPSSRLKDYL